MYVLVRAGSFWLLAGFANEDSALYVDELCAAQAENDNFRLDIALSLQQTNKAGGPAYVQVCVFLRTCVLCFCVQTHMCVFLRTCVFV
jgi:hypothetical protein